MSYFYLREKRKFLFDLWKKKKMMKNICIAQISILDISFLSDYISELFIRMILN